MTRKLKTFLELERTHATFVPCFMLPGFKSLTLTRETDSQSGGLCEDSLSLTACLCLHAMPAAAPLCTTTQEQESEASGYYSSRFVIPPIQPF